MILITFFNIHAKKKVAKKVNIVKTCHQRGMYVYAIPNNTLITAPCIKYISKEYFPRDANSLLLLIGWRHNEVYVNKPTTRLKAIIPNGNISALSQLAQQADIKVSKNSSKMTGLLYLYRTFLIAVS